MITIRFAGWISPRIVSCNRIRISKNCFQTGTGYGAGYPKRFYRYFRIQTFGKVVHWTFITLLSSEASFQPSEHGLLWTWLVMKVVCCEQVCCEWVCYERGLFWMVWYEWSVMNGSALNGNLKYTRQYRLICFELNRWDVAWSSVKSFSDLYKQTQALLLSPVFVVSGLPWVAQRLWLALQRIFWAFPLRVNQKWSESLFWLLLLFLKMWL